MKFYTLIFISIALIASSQNENAIVNYYKYTQKAEEQIIKSNFNKALKLYLKAFHYKKPFISDIRIATEISFQANQKNRIKYFIYNYKLSAFTEKKFTAFIKRMAVKKNIDTCFVAKIRIDTIKKFENNILSERNQVLIKKLEVLENKDQELRVSDIDMSIQNSNINIIDEENFSELIELYRNYKNINESTVGPSGINSIEIILIHNFKNSKRYNKWSSFFINEVKKGNLHNKVYASIVDNYKLYNNSEYGISNSTVVYNKYIYIKPTKQQNRLISEKRKEIFLEPLEKENKKRVWQWLKNTGIIFYPTNEISFSSKFDDFLKSEEELVKMQQEYIDNIKQEVKEYTKEL